MKESDLSQQPNDYDRPVAYDIDGRPLYSHPASQQQDGLESKPNIAPEDGRAKLRHEESIRLYPNLGLSDSEYVINSVGRHYVGLIPAFLSCVVLLTVIFSVMIYSVPISQIFSKNGVTFISPFLIIAIGTVLMLAVLLVTYLAYYVFTNNKFYLTNESIFQTIQISLFNKREQTISLQNIEDASYTQQGILQQVLNYGSIRLSTIGDENTYRLSYVINPKEQIDILNNTVESFKNGRPIK